jgi:CRISPR/Cas system-associated protein Csm6
MKVFEILQTKVNEETLTARLKGFDWKYEFADDVRRQNRGHQAMIQLEAMVYEFWKQNPERACELWVKHSPFGRPGVTPSFILRLEQEGK